MALEHAVRRDDTALKLTAKLQILTAKMTAKFLDGTEFCRILPDITEL
jgi:hypothetical protein